MVSGIMALAMAGASARNTFLQIDGSVLVSQLTDGFGTPLYRSGSGAPSSTPTSVGLTYDDTAGKKTYRSYGTSSSADWGALN